MSGGHISDYLKQTKGVFACMDAVDYEYRPLKYNVQSVSSI